MAAETVETIGRIMQLEKSGAVRGRQVLVSFSGCTKSNRDFIIPQNPKEPVICSIDEAINQDLANIFVERVAKAVVHDIIRNKGGVLIHGALCSLGREGAIMAGPGTVGKTTASNRLPRPWVSLSDDATLILPDGSGGFNAHPWPTWSRFYSDGPGGSWDVEHGIPLKALFFLRQSFNDSIQLLDRPYAKSMVIDTIEHVMRSVRMDRGERRLLIRKCVESSEAVVSSVPAFELYISLAGAFWKEMEKAMPAGSSKETPTQPSDFHSEELKRRRISEIQFIYRGPSMNPTFFEPEVITVEPYAGRKPKAGDVVCFKAKDKSYNVVHRITAVNGDRIRTQGDNNACPDPYEIEMSEIFGRVVYVCRGGKTRRIFGGPAGIAIMHCSRAYNASNRLISAILHRAYRSLSERGRFRMLMPSDGRFAVALFENGSRKYPKLILSGRTIGSYDFTDKAWKIKRPYRLIIDEKRLPIFE
jgi:SynChlorMet cassette protein ScmC